MDTAFILAGGFGKRLRPFVSSVPKPMAPVQGLPFLHHLLQFWQTQGVKHFVISIGYLADHIRDYFGAAFGNCTINYVYETAPLGTGGALLACFEAYPQSSPFLLLNGDTYFAVDLEALDKYATEQDAGVCISLFKTAEKSRYLLLGLRADGSLEREQTKASEYPEGETTFANGGVYWIHPQTMQGLCLGRRQFSFEDELLPIIASSGFKLVGFPSDKPFIDIGIPRDYERAQSLPYFNSL